MIAVANSCNLYDKFLRSISGALLMQNLGLSVHSILIKIFNMFYILAIFSIFF